MGFGMRRPERRISAHVGVTLTLAILSFLPLPIPQAAVGTPARASTCRPGSSRGPSVQAPVYVDNLNGQTSWFAAPVVYDLDNNGSLYQPAGGHSPAWPRYNNLAGPGNDADRNVAGHSGFGCYGLNAGVGNIDDDPELEVIATHGDPDVHDSGNLMILDSGGTVLHDQPLPNSGHNGNGNGAPAAPAVGDLDGDGDLEIFIQTFQHGMEVYSVPGSAENCLLWPTARGGPLRMGQSEPDPVFRDGFESGNAGGWMG